MIHRVGAGAEIGQQSFVAIHMGSGNKFLGYYICKRLCRCDLTQYPVASQNIVNVRLRRKIVRMDGRILRRV